jgi:hypothetical protein
MMINTTAPWSGGWAPDLHLQALKVLPLLLLNLFSGLSSNYITIATPTEFISVPR